MISCFDWLTEITIGTSQFGHVLSSQRTALASPPAMYVWNIALEPLTFDALHPFGQKLVNGMINWSWDKKWILCVSWHHENLKKNP